MWHVPESSNTINELPSSQDNQCPYLMFKNFTLYPSYLVPKSFEQDLVKMADNHKSIVLLMVLFVSGTVEEGMYKMHDANSF